MEPRNQVTMTADPAGVGQAQGRASEHAGVLHVRGSFSSIHHINSRKAAVIQFAPSKSPRLFNSSGQITGTQRWRLSPLTSTALAQASAVGSGMNQGVGCAAAQEASEWSQNLGGLTVWHWPAWSRVPLQRCCAKGCWFQISRLKQMTSWSPTPMSLCQGRQSCWKRRATASLVWSVGSVCVSCFVIPTNWPSLHPTLPYQGTARGGKQTIVADGTLW